MIKRQDLTGMVFGTIKVLGPSKTKEKYWICVCLQCHKRFEKNSQGVKEKGCMSCSRKKHDASYTALYHVWQSMRERCNSDNKNYGGRGIKVCQEWEDFKIFRKWATENNYRSGLEIDRINVNGNYEPCNCRFVIKRIQANNRRNNRYYDIDGINHTLFEWARIYNINYQTLYSRMERGWRIEDALENKVDKRIGQNRSEGITINGVTKSIYEWSEYYKVAVSSVRIRIRKGMPIAEALGVSNE
jgi:hypothetical protein